MDVINSEKLQIIRACARDVFFVFTNLLIRLRPVPLFDTSSTYIPFECNICPNGQDYIFCGN